MKRTKVLITGGSGFIGTNAVEFYLRLGSDVVNVDMRKPQNGAHMQNWVQCDILDNASMKSIFKDFKADWVLHLAARTDLKEKRDLRAYAANIDGVRNTIDAIVSCGTVKRALFASSRMVCRIAYQAKHDADYCPPNLYGESKAYGEQLVRQADLSCTWLIVRPTSIWGPWFDIPYKTFFTSICNRRYFHPGTHNPKKSFGFVGNTVHQIDKLMSVGEDRVGRKTLYLSDYPPLQLHMWADLIREEMGLPPISVLPMPLLKGVATLGDVCSSLGWKSVPLTRFRLDNLITEMVYDVSPLQNIVGPLPYSLSEGVRATVQWMKKYSPDCRRSKE